MFHRLMTRWTSERLLDLTFLGTRRLLVFVAALGVLTSLAPEAMAALQKYDGKLQDRLQYSNTSPEVEDRSISGRYLALIDDAGAAPVLVKYLLNNDQSTTTIVPQLSGGFIYFSQQQRIGPDANQTGTGSTASSIDWGNLTGWSTSGGVFCNAIPSYICPLADAVFLETIGTGNLSTNYDIGTWVFHGTGYTHPGGYILRTNTSGASLGNLMNYVRGTRSQDGTVQALPILGVTAVGLSLLAMGTTVAARIRYK